SRCPFVITSCSLFSMAPAPPAISTLPLHDALPICGDRAQPHRLRFRCAGRRQRPDLPTPRVFRRPRRGRDRRPPLCPALRAHRRSEEHTSELQSRENLVCRLLLEKKKKESKTAD